MTVDKWQGLGRRSCTEWPSVPDTFADHVATSALQPHPTSMHRHISIITESVVVDQAW